MLQVKCGDQSGFSETLGESNEHRERRVVKANYHLG